MKRLIAAMMVTAVLGAAAPALAAQMPALPAPPMAPVLKGCSHSAVGPEYKEAADAFELGQKAAEAGRHQEAIDHFNRAIALNPDDACAYNNRGVSEEALGRPDQAMTSYDRAITIDPSLPYPWENRGYLYQDRGDQARADIDFAHADLAYETFSETS
jgi:Flp pilus assembly protein TadD